jgi:hypothetical protein
MDNWMRMCIFELSCIKDETHGSMESHACTRTHKLIHVDQEPLARMQLARDKEERKHALYIHVKARTKQMQEAEVIETLPSASMRSLRASRDRLLSDASRWVSRFCSHHVCMFSQEGRFVHVVYTRKHSL